MKFPDNRHIKTGALLLGNGINRISEDNDIHSWNSMLQEVALNFADMKYGETKRFLEDGGITFPEFFDITQFIAEIKQNKPVYQDIKKMICNKISDWQPGGHHKRLVNYCIANKIPILTTNFDTNLSKSNDDIIKYTYERNRKKTAKLDYPVYPDRNNEYAPGKLIDVYPWHARYTNDDLIQARGRFAIWHIHGFQHYHRSLRMGLGDYMAMVDRLRGWLHKEPGNPFNDRNKAHIWKGRNSWLEIFLYEPLFIIGLSLDPQEIIIRWLLMERYKLHQKQPIIKQPLYFLVIDGIDRVSESKKKFIEVLGGEILHYHSADELYNIRF